MIPGEVSVGGGDHARARAAVLGGVMVGVHPHDHQALELHTGGATVSQIPAYRHWSPKIELK